MRRAFLISPTAFDSMALKATSSVSRVLEDEFASSYGVAGLLEPKLPVTILPQLIAMNTWHWRCIQTKTMDTLGHGWELVQSVASGLYVESEFDAITDFIERLKILDVLYRALIDYETYGWFALEIVREAYSSSGMVLEVKHIPAGEVRLHRDKKRACQIKNGKKVWFKLHGVKGAVTYERGDIYDDETAVPVDARATELIFRSNYSPLDVHYGVPPIAPAIGAVMTAYYLQRYNTAFFENFGIPSYAIFVTGEYDLGQKVDANGRFETDEGFDATTGEYEIIRELKTYIDKIKQAPHSPLFMAVPSVAGGSVKVEFQKLHSEQKEASFLELARQCRDEILAAHGMPPYRVGLAETGSLGGSTAVESSAIYAESVITPRRTMLEACVNEILRANAWNNWDFKLKDFYEVEKGTDAELALKLWSVGAMTSNEVRDIVGERFGLTKDKSAVALDEYYINGQAVSVLTKPTPSSDEVLQQVKSLHDRLVNLAIKDASKK